MALEFLNKKGFHPSNLRNTEKIWLAEQKAEKEARRLEEFKKQLAEEREILELEQLQEKLGTKQTGVKMDWMYEGPGAGGGASTTFDLDAEKTAEEYLLGKKFEPKEDPADNIKALESKPGSLWLNKQTSNQNEVFSRLQEDPLFLIRQNEKKARESVVYNPVKMARIKEELQQQLDEKKAKKVAKKMKKEAKKAKKKEKKRAKKKAQEQEQFSDAEGSDAGGESTARGGERERRRRTESSRDGHQHKHRGHSRSDRHQERSSSEESPRENRSRDHPRPQGRDDGRHPNKRRTKYGLEYGLQGGKGKRDFSRGELGPTKEMLAKAEERSAKQETSRPLKRQKLSEEERKRRIQEMEQDAQTYEEVRKERTHRTRRKDEHDRHRDEERYKRGSSDPNFLRDMHKEVYTQGGSVQDRMKRNRHYHQKGVDSHKFLDR